MIAPTKSAKMAATRTNPALMSFMILISASLSGEILLQIFSIAVLAISEMRTKVMASKIQSQSVLLMFRIKPRITTVINATRWIKAFRSVLKKHKIPSSA